MKSNGAPLRTDMKNNYNDVMGHSGALLYAQDPLINSRRCETPHYCCGATQLLECGDNMAEETCALLAHLCFQRPLLGNVKVLLQVMKINEYQHRAYT